MSLQIIRKQILNLQHRYYLDLERLKKNPSTDLDVQPCYAKMNEDQSGEMERQGDVTKFTNPS